MSRIKTGLFGLLLVYLTASSQERQIPSAAPPDIPLKDILSRSAAYCEKVKAVALYYVCRQKVEAVRYIYKQRFSHTVNTSIFAKRNQIKFEPRGLKTDAYLYDYQIVKKGDAPSEKWVLIEKNGRKKKQEVPGPVDIRFRSPNLIFAPVGFLSASWQDHFNYEVAGRDILDGRETVIIRCEPKVRGGDNDNVGRIWLDAKEGAILQIEWEPSSIQGFNSEAPEGYRRGLVCSVAFGIEKNGVRFPSREVYREYLADAADRKIPMEEISFDFRDYKFFTVGVDIVYEPGPDPASGN